MYHPKKKKNDENKIIIDTPLPNNKHARFNKSKPCVFKHKNDKRKGRSIDNNNAINEQRDE